MDEKSKEKKPKRPPRSTNAQSKKIFEMVEECMTMLMPRPLIIKSIANQPRISRATQQKLNGMTLEEQAVYKKTLKKINLSDRMIDEYIRKVKDKWEKEDAPKKRYMRLKISNAIEQIIAKANTQQDYRTALMGIESYKKLYGLDEAQKLDIEAKVAKASMEDLRKSRENLKDE
jgi:hypothetical protein